MGVPDKANRVKIYFAQSIIMSIHLATNAAAPIDERDDGCDSDDTDDDDDQTFDDWASDSQPQQTKSLFDDGLFDSADKALTYDKEKHGFELGVVANNLGANATSLFFLFSCLTCHIFHSSFTS